MASTKTIYYHRYLITTCDILIPGEDTIKLKPENIISYTIEKDYDSDYFPIFSLKVNIKYSHYFKIVNNRTNVKFKVRIEKYRFNDYGTSSLNEILIDDVFSIFIDENSDFFDEKMYNTTLSLLGHQENYTGYEFFLFKDADMKSSKKIFNRVISAGNMTNCIGYLLSKSGTSNLLMTPLDNKTSYNEVILPPLTVIQSLVYLEKQYGFYEHGMLFFYDFDTVYLINKRAKCTAFRTNEYQNVICHVYKAEKADSKTPGTYKDSKTKSYTVYITRESITMQAESDIVDQVQGTEVNLIDTKNNSSSTASPDVETRNDTSTYLSNDYSNPYLAKMIENNKYENDNIIDVAFADVDLECFAPNKKFIFSFEEKELNVKYKGDYRLTYTLFTFMNHGDYYSATGQAQFKKTT